MPANLVEFWNDLVPRLISTLPAALAIIVGAIVLRLVAARVLYLLAASTSLTREMVMPFVRLVRIGINVLALVLILGVFGFNLGGLWAMFATVLGMIAIGFVAVWSLLSNTSATLLILILRPFQVGDDIELAGDPVKGRVIDLNFFYTTLLDDDGRLCQIPNNLFFQKTLKRRRNEPPVSLAFQLNATLAADLPPPPPSAKSEPPAKTEENPLMQLPDMKSITPPPPSQQRPGR
jgi:small-conductance mechanosensitive channel